MNGAEPIRVYARRAHTASRRSGWDPHPIIIITKGIKDNSNIIYKVNGLKVVDIITTNRELILNRNIKKEPPFNFISSGEALNILTLLIINVINTIQ